MKKSLTELAVNFGEKAIKIFRHPITKFVVASLILLFGIIYFVTNFREVSLALQQIQINYFFLFLSFVFVIITVIIGAVTWWFILTWFGYHRNFFDITKGYALSSLAKYIPGFIWQYASRSFFLQGFTIPLKVVGVGIITEYLLVTTLGGILTLTSYWFINLKFIQLSILQKSIVFFVLFILIMLILSLPKIIKLIFRNSTNSVYQLKNQYYFIAVLINMLGWILLSIGYYFLLHALGILNISLIDTVFLHSTTFFMSNLFLPIPNGLIVREAILAYLGKSITDQHLLIISSLIFRMAIFISEGIIALLLLLLTKYSYPNNQKS